MIKKSVDNNLLTENGDGRFDDLRRDAYLSGKGIDSKNPEQMQLDFVLKSVPAEYRCLPNDCIRSALFTAKNRNVPRRSMFREKIYHLHENNGVSIIYTGTELRAEDDELVLMQILHYAKKTALGDRVVFNATDLLDDIGWLRNGDSYAHLRDCLTRLKATELVVENKKRYGKSGSMSLIGDYESAGDNILDKKMYRVAINPRLMVLFAGDSFTAHEWASYRSLTPTARKLADYIESHKKPFPLSLDQFKSMCASTSGRLSDWRRQVKSACLVLEEAGIAESVMLGADDKIYISTKK
ncbi:plasmid replication initiator TrfA [Acidithiobacillus sp.]